MTLLEIVPAVALVAACAAYIFYGSEAPTLRAQKTQLEYLRERKEAVYENLRDLNFEYRAGKYPQDDYEGQRNALEAEAAGLLAQIDTAETAPRR
jgi:hypothetical protein